MAEEESEREFESAEPSRKAVRRLRKQGFELGEQIGEGNFGFVFKVRGQPSLAVKVVKDLHQAGRADFRNECRALEVLSDVEAGPHCLWSSKSGALVMQRLEGPALTCRDFALKEVQVRLLEIACVASARGVLVHDNHPGNYLWHEKQIWRVDAVLVPDAALAHAEIARGFRTAPKSVWFYNLRFESTECGSSSLSLLDKWTTVVEWEFGISKKRPSRVLLDRFRSLMLPALSESQQRRLARLRRPPDLDRRPDWSDEGAQQQLVQSIVLLSLARVQLPAPLDQFGEDEKGDLVCFGAQPTDVWTPTSEIWLRNSDMPRSESERSKSLLLFDLAVKLCFASARVAKELHASLKRAGHECDSDCGTLKTELGDLHGWLALGQRPETDLATLEAVLRQLGVEPSELGAAYEELLDQLPSQTPEF